MSTFLKTAALALFATCFVGNAAAQDMPGTPSKIVLESKTGSVMTSAGGEYLTAGAGKVLVVGESVMVADGASATVTYYYDDGDATRTCRELYTGGNTYIIDERCVLAGRMSNNSGWIAPGSNLGAAFIIIGAGLIGAGILSSMDTTPPIGVSVGSR